MSKIRQPEVDKIISVLKTSNKQVLNLNGTWGSGKTYVAEMVFNQLKENKDENKLLPIYINLSDYEYVSDPLVPFLINILEYINQYEVDLLNDPTFLKHISTIVTILSVGSSLIDPSGSLAILLDTFKSIINSMDNVQKADKEEAENSEIKKQIKAVQSYRKALIEMGEVIKQLCAETGKLVVFIDDFDRTSPKFSFRVLNIIHQLKELDKLVICTIMNRAQFEKQLVHIYGDLSGTDEHYLTKFIDLEYMVTNPFNVYDPMETYDPHVNALKDLAIELEIPGVNSPQFGMVISLAKTLSMRELKLFNLNVKKQQYYSYKGNRDTVIVFLFVFSKFEFELKSAWYDLLNSEQLDKLVNGYASYSNNLRSSLTSSLHKCIAPIDAMFNGKIFIKQKVNDKLVEGNIKDVHYVETELELRQLVCLLGLYQHLITT